MEKRIRRLGEVPWLMPSFHYFQGPTILTFAKKVPFSSANITNICPYIGNYLKHFTDFRIYGSLQIRISTSLWSVVWWTISSCYIIEGSGHNNSNTVKVPKWIHFWDEWIQALSQWAARIFFIFKNQRKYCIIIDLELYPFISKVYPFGAFTGTQSVAKIEMINSYLQPQSLKIL